jgi:hypothetical protein
VTLLLVFSGAEELAKGDALAQGRSIIEPLACEGRALGNYTFIPAALHRRSLIGVNRDQIGLSAPCPGYPR